MMMKALGRCVNRHAQVVEYDGEVPSGVCSRCGETLIEWAVKHDAPVKESGR